MPNSKNFEIKNQHFNLIYFIFIIAFAVIFAVGFTIVMLVDSSAQSWEWFILIIPAILLLVSFVGIIACRKTLFAFKDGVFTYKEPFKKAKSASADNISCVHIYKSVKDNDKVIFLDKSGNNVLSFTDDGTIIICKAFTDTLNRLNIAINYF